VAGANIAAGPTTPCPVLNQGGESGNDVPPVRNNRLHLKLSPLWRAVWPSTSGQAASTQ